MLAKTEGMGTARSLEGEVKDWDQHMAEYATSDVRVIEESGEDMWIWRNNAL